MSDLSLSNLQSELARLDQDALRVIGARAVLRSFPHVWEESEDEPRELLLKSFRCALLAWLYMQDEDSTIAVDIKRNATSKLNSHIRFMEDELLGGVHLRSEAAASALAILLDYPASDLLSTTAAVKATLRAVGQNPGFTAVSSDFSLASETAPLWSEHGLPKRTEECLLGLNRELKSDQAWGYWLDWLNTVWVGKSLDPSFAIEVAKIDWDASEGESVWDKSPAKVGARIEELERGFRQDLLDQIQTLKAQLAAKLPDRHGIGGNHPPEAIDIDELPREARDSLIIWEPISALAAEASSETPDKGRARKALEQLVAAAKACGIWAAGHGDTVIGAGAKSVGAAGGTAIVAWIAGYGAQIVKIIETAKLWIGGLL